MPNDESVIGMEKLREFDVKQLNIVNIPPLSVVVCVATGGEHSESTDERRLL